MGKKRIEQLLEQLKANQQEDVQNAAQIFTVAQVAVNALAAQAPEEAQSAIASLPPATLTQADLEQRYGNYKACRRAAKNRGIKFSKNPSWAQLVAAFTYAEALEQLARSYLAAHPYPFPPGTTLQLSLIPGGYSSGQTRKQV